MSRVQRFCLTSCKPIVHPVGLLLAGTAMYEAVCSKFFHRVVKCWGLTCLSQSKLVFFRSDYRGNGRDRHSRRWTDYYKIKQWSCGIVNVPTSELYRIITPIWSFILDRFLQSPMCILDDLVYFLRIFVDHILALKFPRSTQGNDSQI